MSLIQFKAPGHIRAVRAAGKTVTVASVLGALLSVSAQAAMYRPAATPGGIDAHPVINSVSVSGSNVTLNFQGMEAPYEAQVAPMGSSNWAVGATTALKWPHYAGSVTVSNVAANSLLRMNMVGETYVGAYRCYACHGDKVGGPVLVQATNANGERIVVTNGMSGWLGTAHAQALDVHLDANGAIPDFRMQNCVVCHSTGLGQPGGFTDVTNTPHLAHVGCETCHGPAGAHVTISGRQYHPVNTVAAEACGGCHTGSHHPTYDEWTNAAHVHVTADVAGGSSGMTNAGPTGFGRQMACGACHSGATFLAMLGEYEDRLAGVTNRLNLPEGADAGHFGITCAVCHDPHSTNGGPSQLRFPLASTQYHTFFTTSVSSNYYWTNVFGQVQTNVFYYNDGFVSQLDPNVQICAQCHNSRGARWDGLGRIWTGSNFVMGTTGSWSRPPHHSPQYNILTGIIQPDYLNGTANMFGPHGLITNGCVQCHMHKEEFVSEAQPAITGHRFEPEMAGCVASDCHISANVTAAYLTAVQMDTTARIEEIVGLLNRWGTNKAPEVLRTNYGRYSWEYTTAGQLSNPGGTNTLPGTTNIITGPSSTGQVLVPEQIKKARFNVYMVEHDGSQGAHNKDYTRFLLNNAKTNVLEMLR